MQYPVFRWFGSSKDGHVLSRHQYKTVISLINLRLGKSSPSLGLWEKNQLQLKNYANLYSPKIVTTQPQENESLHRT